MSDDKVAELYGTLCDIAFRAMCPEWDVEDGLLHTSNEARRVATKIMNAFQEWGAGLGS